MTQVDDRHQVLVDVPEDTSQSPARVIDLAAPGGDAAVEPVVLRAPRPLLGVVALVGAAGAVVAAVVVGVAAPDGGAGVAAASTLCAVLAVVLLLVAFATRRSLQASDDGVAHSDGLRRRWCPWDRVERVEVAGGRLRRPRIVLVGGRGVAVPARSTRSASGGLSPLDRLVARAGAAGVPVVTTRSRPGVWSWSLVVLAGVVTGLGVGVWLAGMMIGRGALP